MSKKRDNEDLDRIDATYDALFNNLDEVPIEEVRRALADAGVDRSALRERLHERANAMARAGRASGRSAPPALARLLEQTGDARTLTADPTRALDKAKRYLADLFSPGTGGAQVVGAFRGEGELSDRDKETIDEIDAELRARTEATEQDDTEKT